MTEKLLPERLFELGYADLISVIPPGAPLSPLSKIPASALGKTPGRRLPSNVWAGYKWREHRATAADVKKWCIEDRASVGLRSGYFPGLDIDCLDAGLVSIIEQMALSVLGPAPIRVGRAPKRLLVYRTAEPFAKMKLQITTINGEKHLVEFLGHGQQFLVHGLHPATQLPYTWLTEVPPAAELTLITREAASKFLDELAAALTALGIGIVKRSGEGAAAATGTEGGQEALRAPSVEVLREAVGKIPNTDEHFPGRDEYIRMGYAIKAAAGDDHENEGYEIFANWAGRHESDGRVSGNPETWLSDWRRLLPPYAVGWGWLAELARGFGFEDAALDFDVVAEAPTGEETAHEPLHSEQWLARKVIERQRSILRYVPQRRKWLVWDSGRWRLDANLLAEDIIKGTLKQIANEILRRGVTEKEQKESQAKADSICSAWKLAAVTKLVQSDREIAISNESLDSDPWVLNTPGGVVDLRTGKLGVCDPEALCSKSTAAVPDFGADCPEWRRFLAEATAEDVDVQNYLQRLAGYALTGSVREQQLTFIWGGGGNGKSVFLNVLSGILADYAVTATMDVFTSSRTERHSTDVAMLQGARLITASETEAGKKWDEARVKSLTGAEKVSARLMRQDNITFLPTGKIIFVGNHKPELRTVTPAMRRRLQIVPFNVTPKVVDMELGEKLQKEWPAILAWMIEGCLLWQQHGLTPPNVVQAETADYFEGEDAIGQWIVECIEDDTTTAGRSTSSALFASWREWANANGEPEGSMKRLTSALVARKWERWREMGTRRMGFAGKRIKDRVDFGIVT